MSTTADTAPADAIWDPRTATTEYTDPVCPQGCVSSGPVREYDPYIGNWPEDGETRILGIVIPGIQGAAYYECGQCLERFARFPYGHPIQVAAEAYWDVCDGEVENENVLQDALRRVTLARSDTRGDDKSRTH